MTYWILTIILANGAHVPELAYGTPYLCDRAAQGRQHICMAIHYDTDRQ